MNIKKALLATSLVTASSVALAIPTLDQIIGSAPALANNGAESFTLSDFDGISDDFFATIVLEQASYESNMGIYDFTVDSYGNVTIHDTLEIFAASNEPGILTGSQTVNFDLINNIAFIDDDGITGYSVTDTQSNIGQNFGFYLEVTNTHNTFYSHVSENADGVDHLAVFETAGQGGSTNSFDLILAWEDLYNGGDEDYTDMVVAINDISAVSEPGTLALLGLGLFGLGAARRKQKA
jgi:hypothetical protein